MAYQGDHHRRHRELGKSNLVNSELSIPMPEVRRTAMAYQGDHTRRCSDFIKDTDEKPLRTLKAPPSPIEEMRNSVLVLIDCMTKICSAPPSWQQCIALDQLKTLKCKLDENPNWPGPPPIGFGKWEEHERS